MYKNWNHRKGSVLREMEAGCGSAIEIYCGEYTVKYIFLYYRTRKVSSKLHRSLAENSEQ